MKHNYKNYSNPGNRATRAVDEVVPAEVTEDVKEVIAEAAANEEVDVDESASIESTPVEPTITEVEEDSKIGKVVNCKRLNIRKNPNKDSEPVCIVNAGTVVMIDLNGVTVPGWYPVYTEAGIKGYCMKEFIEISK